MYKTPTQIEDNKIPSDLTIFTQIDQNQFTLYIVKCGILVHYLEMHSHVFVPHSRPYLLLKLYSKLDLPYLINSKCTFSIIDFRIGLVQNPYLLFFASI